MREQPSIADLETRTADPDGAEQEAVIAEVVELLAKALLLAVQGDRDLDGSFPSGNEPYE